MSKQRPPIHQLANFKIDEVSLVDRGANKQRFVIIKRETDMQEAQTPSETTTDDPEAGHQDLAPNNTPTHKEQPAPAPDAQRTPSVEILSGAQALAALPDTLAALREMVTTINAKAQGGTKANVPQENAPSNKTAASVAKIEKRLERLEKHFCLPNSTAGDEPHSAIDSHVWPFDLNANRGKA